MVKLLLSLMVLPLLTGSGWAAERLNDAQMDRITKSSLRRLRGVHPVRCYNLLIQAMRRLFCASTVVPFLTGAAFAAGPIQLNDTQMDAVTAGEVFLFSLTEIDIGNAGTVMVNIDPVNCMSCFLNIKNEAFTLQAQFGPTPGSNSFVFLGNGP
jgi:hypothetical protein